MFQDRFKSEPVEDDTYFLTVLRYILQNPLKAGLVTKIHNYTWTNYMDYVKQSNMTDIDFVLDIFNTDREKAVKCFIEYVTKENDDECLEIMEKQQITDDDVRKIIKDHCNIHHGGKFTKDRHA